MGRSTRAGLAALCLVFAVSSLAAQTTDIVFENRTGATIYFLYASGTTSDTWGEDLLGRTVLPDGSTFRARLRSSAPSFDIRAVDASDNEYLIWGWTPGSSSRVVLGAEAFVGSRGAADSSDALSWIVIVNDTNYDIVEIHLSPSSANEWNDGEQLLGPGEIVHHGEDFRVDIDADRYDTLVYNIMLVDVDGDRYIKWGVNLELETQIVYTLDDLEWR
ncbi:MAG: hypothetical protein ACOC1I_07770 [Spirochaetota bacterium]